MKSLLLLSGGMDSIALAYWQRPSATLFVDYGQVSADGERRAAAHVADMLGLAHEAIAVDCRSLGSGDLAGRPPHPNAPVREWWPFRNQLLLTFGAMRALSAGCDLVWLGSVSTDGCHADGRAEFYQKADELVSSQEGSLRIEAPGLKFTSPELIRRSAVPRSILSWAHSCHTDSVACGTCRGCSKHREVTAAVWGVEEAY
jgi:7-cyano-7-deazaguanine synthase